MIPEKTLNLLKQWRTPFPDYYDQAAPSLHIKYMPGDEINSMHPLSGQDLIVLMDGSGHLVSIPADWHETLLMLLTEEAENGPGRIRWLIHGWTNHAQAARQRQRKGRKSPTSKPEIRLSDLDLSKR